MLDLSDARKVIRILLEAHEGCDTCAYWLAIEFIREWPEYFEETRKLFVARHGSGADDDFKNKGNWFILTDSFTIPKEGKYEARQLDAETFAEIIETAHKHKNLKACLHNEKSVELIKKLTLGKVQLELNPEPVGEIDDIRVLLIMTPKNPKTDEYEFWRIIYKTKWREVE